MSIGANKKRLTVALALGLVCSWALVISSDSTSADGSNPLTSADFSRAKSDLTGTCNKGFNNVTSGNWDKSNHSSHPSWPSFSQEFSSSNPSCSGSQWGTCYTHKHHGLLHLSCKTKHHHDLISESPGASWINEAKQGSDCFAKMSADNTGDKHEKNGTVCPDEPNEWNFNITGCSNSWASSKLAGLKTKSDALNAKIKAVENQIATADSADEGSQKWYANKMASLGYLLAYKAQVYSAAMCGLWGYRLDSDCDTNTKYKVEKLIQCTGVRAWKSYKHGVNFMANRNKLCDDLECGNVTANNCQQDLPSTLDKIGPSVSLNPGRCEDDFCSSSQNSGEVVCACTNLTGQSCATACAPFQGLVDEWNEVLKKNAEGEGADGPDEEPPIECACRDASSLICPEMCSSDAWSDHRACQCANNPGLTKCSSGDDDDDGNQPPQDDDPDGPGNNGGCVGVDCAPDVPDTDGGTGVGDGDGDGDGFGGNEGAGIISDGDYDVASLGDGTGYSGSGGGGGSGGSGSSSGSALMGSGSGSLLGPNLLTDSEEESEEGVESALMGGGEGGGGAGSGGAKTTPGGTGGFRSGRSLSSKDDESKNKKDSKSSARSIASEGENIFQIVSNRYDQEVHSGSLEAAPAESFQDSASGGSTGI